MKQHRLRWMENWTTGINWLDEQHRDLVDYYHGVVDAVRNDAGDGAFVERLNHVREWLGQHFLNEESVLQQITYQKIHQHKQDYAQLVATLEDFAANCQNVYGHDKTAACRYIFYWLIRHGNAYDAKISSYVP